MFGVIVASRPVITDAQTVDEDKFAFIIPSQPSFSHVAVFILPGQMLDPGYAAAVFIQIPPATDFKLLGAIGNQKQSAVYKIQGAGASDSSGPGHVAPTDGDDVMVDDATLQPVANGEQPAGANIVLGISVEPIAKVEARLATLKQPQPQPQPSQSQLPTKVLAQRIIQNAFNFLSSFATGSGGNEKVPLKSFHDWWTKFEKRLDRDPGFLEREEESG